ncbi:MAG: hypothetical protein HYU84_16930, partial [Chloroflexi bacterium]|nr:hypothetical protein [Chloroflexota bacterium]
MKTHKIFHLVLGIIFIFSLLGTPGTATAQDPGPIIWGVITSSNWITGQNWPINAVVWINIDDPSTPQNPDSTAIQNTNANGSFNHQSQYDISTGFVISVTDGNITKWVTISDFEVTEFDAKTKTLSGIGSPNTTAAIWILNPQGNVSFVIDPTGHWQVNLTGIADIKPWSRGFAIEQDLDGDGTQSNWPPHYIEASINGPGHSVTGYDWHLGTSITLTVDNPGNGAGIDRTDIQTVEPGNWGTTQVDFHLGDFGLEPGSLVTLTDGAIIQHHTVAYLDITDIDTETDNIFGKAEPGAIVEVNFHDGNQLVWRHVNAVQSGDWVVDFSTPGLGDDEQSLIDIQPGKGFSTRQYDDGGNSTRLYWVVPKYRVVAYSDGDMIIATDFWPGTPVTITVDDPDNGVGIDLTRSGVVSTDPSGWECQTWWGYCFVLDLGGEFDVQAGQLITITDGIRTRSHVVTTLQITDVNWVNSTISGIAEPLSEINLDLWPSCGQRHLFANASGNWIEDFSIPGDENFEQEPCDFSTDELRDIIAYQKSGDGETWVSREISTPRFMLNIYNDSSWHEVTAWNWPLGAQVTLTVDDPGTPQNPDYTEVKTMGPRSGSYPTGASYLQNNEFDGHPGFTITLSDGIQTKSMLVPQLQGTEYNLEDDTVSGLTDPFARVVVACDVGAEPTVIADSGGNWMANFRDLENPEVVLYDIKPGTWCEPQMTDNDYDHIVLRNWSVPLNQPPQITSISAPVYPV